MKFHPETGSPRYYPVVISAGFRALPLFLALIIHIVSREHYLLESGLRWAKYNENNMQYLM